MRIARYNNTKKNAQKLQNLQFIEAKFCLFFVFHYNGLSFVFKR